MHATLPLTPPYPDLLCSRIPRCILIAGACGIGLFIMFVGWKGMGVVVADAYPNLVRLNTGACLHQLPLPRLEAVGWFLALEGSCS
jgi:xanthine/uracil/vitamin C permease (AzgA family)